LIQSLLIEAQLGLLDSGGRSPTADHDLYPFLGEFPGFAYTGAQEPLFEQDVGMGFGK